MEQTSEKSRQAAAGCGSQGRLPGNRRLDGVRFRLVLVGVAFCAYVLSFVLVENVYGKGGATTIVLLVAAVSWLFGLVPGLLASLLAFPLNYFMYSVMGAERQELLGGGGIAGMSAIVLIAAVLGRLRDLSRRLTAELAERRRTEDALRSSRDQLDNLIRTSLDPIVITDTNALVSRANQAFLDMIGYSEQEVIGMPLYSFSVTAPGCYEATTAEQISIDADFIEQRRKHMMDVLAREGKLSNWPTYFTAKSGRIVPATANVVFQFNAAGERIGAFAIIRDITEQRKSELELISSREEAVEANRFRSRFFTNITHEFRTPLTLAIGPLEGILRGEFGPLESGMREQVSLALRNSRQLLKLVNQLLDFSMAESGSAQLLWEEKDLGGIVSAVLDAFSLIAEKKKIAVNLDLEPSLPAVPVDAASYEKVLFNLLGNAFRFTPEGGRVAVGLGRASGAVPGDETVVTRAAASSMASGSFVRLCIRDSGLGIRPEHLRIIFDRFKQSGENLALERGGSGIGLAHTRELVESMCGTITVKSDLGEGSQFCVYLPMEQPEARPVNRRETQNDSAGSRPALSGEVETLDVAGEHQFAAQSLSGSKPLLLIVEDNRDVLSYIAGIVRKDYDYICAENGREALRLLEQHAPALIISDIMMPHMDGYALLKAVRGSERWKTLPFIFLTAKADVDMRVEGLEAGADDYITKPFNSLELLARVKAVLRMRALQQKTDRQEREIDELTRRLNTTGSYSGIVGTSPAMHRVYTLIETIKHSDSHVLISGETGTGKELVARAIHASSTHSQGPFVTVNCGAIPANLAESEFFGHVKGAFTGAVREGRGFFQAADGGTLFLDEIGEMSLDMQVKLLRVLEHGEFMRVGSSSPSKVNARIIVATNKNLKEEVISGNFREDLYFRIHIVPIHLPPLRQRREDIPLLIEHFLDDYAKRHTVAPPRLSQGDMAFFLQYSYPGNVRELQNMVERLCLMGRSAAELFGPGGDGGLSSPQSESTDSAGFFDSDDPLRDARSSVEKDIILQALEMCRNNHTQAAAVLKISRAALYKKIRQYGLKDGNV